MWLPALGAVLFLVVGLLWGLYPSDSPSSDAAGTPAATGSAAAPAATNKR